MRIPTAALAALVCPCALHAGRPLVIDDAEPVPPGLLEIEAGFSYAAFDSHDHYHLPIALATGVLPDLEAGLGFGGQLQEGAEIQQTPRSVAGIGDLQLGLKWKPIDQSRWPADVAFAGLIKFPTASRSDGLGSGEIDYDATLILSRALGEKANIHLNAGYSWIGDPPSESLGDLFHGGVAVDCMLTSSIQCIGELFGQRELRSGGETVVQWTAGLRWMMSPNLTFDVAAGTTLRGSGADFAVLCGITWTSEFFRRKG
ncbi:MAG TPA: transporter [Verrucomicrobiota bacterium]|nr:transporter [Verrucomicrobiota bacterium]